MAQTNGSLSHQDGMSPKITFYTNRSCPWAHRAAIALKELGIAHEEVVIPLDRPREPWYLEINPRGLVPSIRISNGVLKDEIVTESAIVSTFLADMYPKSSFYPPSHESPTSALKRARMTFFVDTWFTKVNTFFYAIMKAEGEDKLDQGKRLAKAMENEIEPLLQDAGPFFGGSQTMTLADALTAPFAIRYASFSKEGLMPSEMGKAIESLPNYRKWSQAVCAQESVTYVFDGPAYSKAASERLSKMKAEQK